jgi:hypothetical protein
MATPPYVTGKRFRSKWQAFRRGIKKNTTKAVRRPRIVISIPGATLSEWAESKDAFDLGGDVQLLTFYVAPRVQETIHSYDDQPLAGPQARVPISRSTAFALFFVFRLGTITATGAAGSAAIRSTIAAANPATSKRHASFGPDSERPKELSGSDFTEAQPKRRAGIERPTLLHFAELPQRGECREYPYDDDGRKIQGNREILVRSGGICLVRRNFGCGSGSEQRVRVWPGVGRIWKTLRDQLGGRHCRRIYD